MGGNRIKDKKCCLGYPNCIHTMDGKPRKEFNFMTDKTKELANALHALFTQGNGTK